MHLTATRNFVPRFAATLAFVIALASSGQAHAAPGTSEPSGDWPTYLGNKERNLYSPLRQINRENVSKLKMAWSYDTGDKGEYQANNLVVEGVLYTASPTRKVIALDA